MNTPDLTTDDEINEGAAAASATENDLARQFLHTGYSFKGQQLRPYTAGTDLLFNQVLDRNDAPFTIFLSFIFIHQACNWTLNEQKKLVPTREFLLACWDKLSFRAALLEWIDSLGAISNADKMDAMNLFEEIRGWARKSSVEVIPDPGQKKTKATRRQRSPA
jgi:hypothetical protein